MLLFYQKDEKSIKGFKGRKQQINTAQQLSPLLILWSQPQRRSFNMLPLLTKRQK